MAVPVGSGGQLVDELASVGEVGQRFVVGGDGGESDGGGGRCARQLALLSLEPWWVILALSSAAL